MTRAPRWPSTLSSASTPGSTSSSATRRALGSEGRTRTPTDSCGSTSRRDPTCPGTPAVTSTPLRSRSTQGRESPSPGRLPPRPSTSFFYARPDTAALRRPLEPGLGALVRVDYCPVARVALADGHAERVGDQRRVLGRVDRPADHSPGEQVEHDGAVHLAFPGGVLGDVGDPEPVWVVASEVPVDEVAGGGLVGDAPVLRATRQALQAGLAHQQPHGFLADGEAVAEGELGVHAPVAVHAAEIDVDLADQVGEPGVADRPL